MGKWALLKVDLFLKQLKIIKVSGGSRFQDYKSGRIIFVLWVVHMLRDKMHQKILQIYVNLLLVKSRQCPRKATTIGWLVADLPTFFLQESQHEVDLNSQPPRCSHGYCTIHVFIYSCTLHENLVLW